MLHVAVALVALVAPAVSSSSSSSGSKPATVACPRGDAPGPRGALRVGAVDVDVSIAAGAARVRWSIVLHNDGDGPASTQLTLPVDDPLFPVVVDGARRVGHRRAAIGEPDEARDRFDAFVGALDNGVDAEDAVAGSDRAATLTTLDTDPVIDVAAACSERQIVLHVDGGVLARPRAGGQRYVLPRLTDHDRVIVHADDADVWVGGTALPASGVVMRLPVARTNDHELDDVIDPAAAAPHAIDVRPHTMTLQANAVRHAAGNDHDLVHLGVDVPTTLTTVPAGLQLVFVVDGSVSIGDAGVALALRQVQRLLDAAPADTTWSLIVAARTPRIVVSPGRPRDARFIPQIDLDNGSDIAAAVARATRIADDADGTARVIVLSDLQQLPAHAKQLDTLYASTTLAPTSTSSSSVVHIVRLPDDAGDDDVLQWERDAWMRDEHGHDSAVRGGVYVVANAGGSVDDERALAAWLIRPTHLDDVVFVTDGMAIAAEDDAPLAQTIYDARGLEQPTNEPQRLHEGESLRVSALVPSVRRVVAVRARLWNETIDLPLVDIGAARAAYAGTAVNGTLRSLVDEDTTRTLATSLGFVSSQTALVDVPAWRPARPDDVGLSGYGCSATCGCGGPYTTGFGSRIGCNMRAPTVLKAQTLLDEVGASIARRCGTGYSVRIDVGDLEILDVATMMTIERAPLRCVRELWWQTRLDRLTPGDGSFEAHSSFVVSVDAPVTNDDGSVHDFPFN